MIKVEQYGTRQKKTCFGCGSIISFENEDIEKGEGNLTFVKCPVCEKHIKARKMNYIKGYKKAEDVKDTEIGQKIQDAMKGDDENADS